MCSETRDHEQRNSTDALLCCKHRSVEKYGQCKVYLSCLVFVFNLDAKGLHAAVVVHVSNYVSDSSAYTDSSSSESWMSGHET